MDLGLKKTNETYDAAPNDSRAVSAPAIVAVATAEDLQNRLNEAKEELTVAIDNADGEQILTLRDELKRLPVLIQTAKATELRSRLVELENLLETTTDSIKLIDAVRVQRKAELEAKLDELLPYYTNYEKCQLELSLAHNKISLIQTEFREKKSVLFRIGEDMRNN